MSDPAIALLEFDSISAGIVTGDAMVYGTLEEAEVGRAMAEHLAEEGDTRVMQTDGREMRIVAQSILIKAP